MAERGFNWSPVLLAVWAFTGCGGPVGPVDPVFTAEAWSGDPVVVADSGTYHRPGAVQAADLDRDGDLDIAAVGPACLLWFENLDGLGGAFRRHAVDGEGCANGLLVLDMDGDRLPDLVSAGGGPPEGRTMPGPLYWWKNPGEAALPWKRRSLDQAPGNFLHDILAADLDRDGVPEIVAPRGAAYLKGDDRACDRIGVYRRISPAGEPRWVPLVLTGGQGVIKPEDFGLAAGDMNGDGYMDLVQFQTLWINPKGRLEEPWTGLAWTVDIHPSNLEVRDMDGDGDADLVFTEGHSHRKGFSRVGIWFNGSGADGTVRGTVRVLGKVRQDPENLAVADLDGNGVPDIVTGAMNWRAPPGRIDRPSWNDTDGTLAIFAGSPAGDAGPTWHLFTVREGITALHHLVLADMDGDGDLDVVGETAGAAPPPAETVPSVQILRNRSR